MYNKQFDLSLLRQAEMYVKEMKYFISYLIEIEIESSFKKLQNSKSKHKTSYVFHWAVERFLFAVSVTV